MLFKRLLLAFLWLAIAAGPTQADKRAEVGDAQAGDIAELVPPLKIKFGRASSVQFHVSIFGMFKKRGSFTQMHGTLFVNKNTARVSARIQTASAVMKSESDGALLKSPAYFDAARFPEIIFKSDSFPIATLRQGGQIGGDLTVRGIRQKQSFTLIAKPCASAFAQTPWHCAFEVIGTLNRSEFGMKARRGIVSDEVQLALLIAGGH